MMKIGLGWDGIEKLWLCGLYDTGFENTELSWGLNTNVRIKESG
jgi:hypothetical protein